MIWASLALAAERPSVVFVLVDDMSAALLPTMAEVGRMRAEGTSFDNYFVNDSLCCPSRTSILTGNFPHDTGVFDNSGDDGGYRAFLANDNEPRSFAVALQAAGWRTGFMGKYINGYAPEKHGVPSGWEVWDVAGDGYRQYDYSMNHNGKVRRHGSKEEDYLTDVLARRAEAFVRESVRQQKPFFLEVAPFAPHSPFTPAPRHLGLFPDLQAPRSPAFLHRPGPTAPAWLRAIPAIEKAGDLDESFRKQARSLQAVDELLARLRALSAELAVPTWFFFSSDNGFHYGDHSLKPGKMTAFDTDIRVPLVVSGPGVAHREVDAVVHSVDLHPSFVELAEATPFPGVDGRSLLPWLRGETPAGWRSHTLIEHHGEPAPKDPDKQKKAQANPPDYSALRSRDMLYVEYATGEREYYDRQADPHELVNRAGELGAELLEGLHAQLYAATSCHDAASCDRALGAKQD